MGDSEFQFFGVGWKVKGFVAVDRRSFGLGWRLAGSRVGQELAGDPGGVIQLDG